MHFQSLINTVFHSADGIKRWWNCSKAGFWLLLQFIISVKMLHMLCVSILLWLLDCTHFRFKCSLVFSINFVYINLKPSRFAFNLLSFFVLCCVKLWNSFEALNIVTVWQHTLKHWDQYRHCLQSDLLKTFCPYCQMLKLAVLDVATWTGCLQWTIRPLSASCICIFFYNRQWVPMKSLKGKTNLQMYFFFSMSFNLFFLHKVGWTAFLTNKLESMEIWFILDCLKIKKGNIV